MEQTVHVTLRQQDDGRYLASCLEPRLAVVAESEDEAIEQLQEELTFALESAYAGKFAGNFRAKDVMVTLEVEKL
jgi:predicted RNase H-like HicB family nuclease